MKNETAERWMLLKQSGELDPVRSWLLERHFAHHPEARDAMDGMNRLADAVRRMPIAGPGEDVIAAIQREARAATGRSVEVNGAPSRKPAWRPALAWAAAAAALAVASWLVVQQPQQAQEHRVAAAADDAELAWDNGIDSDLAELSSMLALANDETEATADASTDLDTIVTELIALEGSEI